MYKITLCDANCASINEGTTSFFTDDLDEFESNWFQCAERDQLERYKLSKQGKVVIDSYSQNPKLNILQEDMNVEIFFEKELVIKNRKLSLLNTYRWPVEVYAAETRIVFRGIRFLGECLLVGRYKMTGVCQKKSPLDNDNNFETIRIYGNPIIKSKRLEKPVWNEKNGEREFINYKKEDFIEDSIETYCFVTVGWFSEEELKSENIALETDEIMISLLRDIPGEAG